MSSAQRHAWIDYAKGFTIIMVVNMHVYYSYVKYIDCSTIVGYFVEWAQLFRMPLFFVIAGLFAARSLTLKLSDFVDKKILHFAYFYLLWLGVFAVIRSTGNVHIGVKYFTSNLIDSNSTLWFIYILALFFIAFRALKNVSPLIILLIAFALHLTHMRTGNGYVDEFAHRWVFFLIGAYFSGYILEKVSTTTISLKSSIINFIGFMAIATLAFKYKLVVTSHHLTAASVQDVVNGLLTFGLALWGITSTILIVKQIADRNIFGFLKIAGQKSLQIYLAFFIFMLPMRLLIGAVIAKTGFKDILILNDFFIIAITIFAVAGTVYLDHLVKNVWVFKPFQFIFVRPRWAHLSIWIASKNKKQTNLAPAE